MRQGRLTEPHCASCESCQITDYGAEHSQDYGAEQSLALSQDYGAESYEITVRKFWLAAMVGADAIAACGSFPEMI